MFRHMTDIFCGLAIQGDSDWAQLGCGHLGNYARLTRMKGTHFKRKLNDISVMNTVRLLSVNGYTIKVISYLNMF